MFVHSPGALPTLPPPRYATACALGDIDTDGDLDGYLSNESWQSVHVYVNDGRAIFVDEPQRQPEHLEGDICFVDLDLDGAPELVSVTRLFRNGGRGQFVEAELSRPLGFGAQLAVGDIDLDGDADLLAIDAVQTALATGFARHLEALGPARLGKRLTLAVHGAPRTPYNVLESLGTLRVPLGALGWLLVDPSRIVSTTGGYLDGRGAALLQRMLPPSPALLGRESYWQAFVGRPAHATNLVVTRITGL